MEVLAASQSSLNKNWFQGTADAVRQYMWLFDEAVRDGVEDFLILSGGWLGVAGGEDFLLMAGSRCVWGGAPLSRLWSPCGSPS